MLSNSENSPTKLKHALIFLVKVGRTPSKTRREWCSHCIRVWNVAFRCDRSEGKRDRARWTSIVDAGVELDDDGAAPDWQKRILCNWLHNVREQSEQASPSAQIQRARAAGYLDSLATSPTPAQKEPTAQSSATMRKKRIGRVPFPAPRPVVAIRPLPQAAHQISARRWSVTIFLSSTASEQNS
jgi:hypothetical protein